MRGGGNATGLAALLRITAIAAAVTLPVAGCSPEIGYPAIHDMPAPRADTPLTPDQIKQATDDLISEREHLSTAAQAAAQPGAGTNGASDLRKRPPPSAPPPPAQPVVQAADPAIVQSSGTAAKQ